MENRSITLVIFTCENREHLLLKTFNSFLENCNYTFDKIIIGVDGKFNYEILNQISPHIIVQNINRGGYVNNIINTLKVINTPYFFWLEDDWKFHTELDLSPLIFALQSNPSWSEIVLSKTGPLNTDQKIKKISQNLYQTTFGFSANPSLCNTGLIQSAFDALEKAPKGSKLGEDGFENFLTKKFHQDNIKCIILDPVDHLQISHEGYLESTPRNFHMTNSIENITKEHLFIFPVPSFSRRLLMIIKLFTTLITLAFKQFTSNKVYEYCFRVVTGYQTLK